MDDTQQNQAQVNNSPVGFPGPSAPTPAPQSKKNWKWLIILILFLVVIGGVTFFVFKSSRSTSTLDESPTPDTSSLTNVATPTPQATASSEPVDKSTIKVQVLNGTGIAGEASFLSDQLKSLGYTSITTGNSSAQNATDTQVTFSSGVADSVQTELVAKLKELYTSVTTNNSTLTDADIQIVTGLRKGQTAAPDATATPEAEATDTPTPTASPTATP